MQVITSGVQVLAKPGRFSLLCATILKHLFARFCVLYSVEQSAYYAAERGVNVIMMLLFGLQKY